MLNKIDIIPDRQKLIIYLFLTVVTLAVFWQVNQYDFINLDDSAYVTENSHIKSEITLDGLRWAFSTTSAEFWHPLTWLSLMFDYQLFGLNAGGYHLTNLILHLMSALLLFWLFNRMTGAIWKSAFVAALFALHPLHVESVAWIAERKDVLSAFFWMLTLCLYVYYTEKPVIRRYLIVLLCFACGLMSKSIVVTLPIVMILLDYWPLDRLQSNKKKLSETKIMGIIPLWQLWEKIPFFVFSLIFSTITLYAQPSVKHFPLSSRLANASVSFVTYLAKIIWPHDLAVFYPFSVQLPVWQVWGTALLILAISVAVITAVKRLPYLFVGWLWYAITILPVIGIIQIGNAAMADRFTYLPSIGIAIMLAWGIPFLFPREDIRKKIIFPVGIIFLTIISFLSWNQCGYWKDSIILWSHTLKVTNYNWFAYNLRGKAYTGLGYDRQAIDDFNRVIEIKPADYADDYFNRGTAYLNLGNHRRAIDDFNRAIKIKPDYAEAYINRGFAYSGLGNYKQEIEDYGRAIDIRPKYTIAYINRSTSYLTLGNKELGCRDAQKACALGDCKIIEEAKGKGYCR